MGHEKKGAQNLTRSGTPQERKEIEALEHRPLSLHDEKRVLPLECERVYGRRFVIQHDEEWSGSRSTAQEYSKKEGGFPKQKFFLVCTYLPAYFLEYSKSCYNLTPVETTEFSTNFL